MASLKLLVALAYKKQFSLILDPKLFNVRGPD